MNVRARLFFEKNVARPLDAQSGFPLPFRMGEGQGEGWRENRRAVAVLCRPCGKVVGKQLLALLALLFVGHQAAVGANILEAGFANPPMEARLHAYWWWLNGNVTKEAITRDLEAMLEKGFGGALIMDAGGADNDKNQPVPPGPVFGSPAWRELYRHTLREAARLKMELALNIQSGWNLGGPSVTPADAKKILCWTETVVVGPGRVTTNLPAAKARNGLLKEVAVVAVPNQNGKADPISNWPEKALYQVMRGSAPDTSELLGSSSSGRKSAPSKPESGKEVRAGSRRLLQSSEPDHTSPLLDPANVLDLAQFVDAAGTLTWTVPDGEWRVYRFGYTVAPGNQVKTFSADWGGLAIDPLDAGAFQRYWDAVVEPLLQEAAAIGGSTLKYLHTDSWELHPYNWTARLPEAFRRQCGYDLRPWLPVLAGRKVGGTEASDRFLNDFRKTVATLSAENHFQTFLNNAHRHGLQVRAESGGPHAVPIDAQHCLGMIDAPMSEFWATSWRHRVRDEDRFFVKQPASAAHTYGKQIVAAEGFTTIGPHWQERVWHNLKPAFDRALCEGLNQLVWTLVACSPREMGMPGQDMFAGTHFNPNSTWWRQSEGFLSYINRCQWLLRQGQFVADVLYYYGDHAPNFAQLKQSNPAQLPAGHDYDVATEYVVLNRLSVKNGRMVLPDGMSYGALVLSPHRSVSLAVLRKLRALAETGGVIIGARPESSSGLNAWRSGDSEAKALIDVLWGKAGAGNGLVRFAAASEWVKATGLPPDFTVRESANCRLDYIHRRDGGTEIYFVANRDGKPARGSVRFRVAGKLPELWNACDGTMRYLPQWRAAETGTTGVPLELEPFGTAFIVFRESNQPPHQPPAEITRANFPRFTPQIDIAGPWRVAFDPAWFYPDDATGGNLMMEELADWTQRPEAAVKYFSGAAVYRTSFDVASAVAVGGKKICLSVGEVHEMARVRLNGRDLGIAWCPPWQLPIPEGLLTAKNNQLEIEVVNFWPNRLIGDAKLPPAQRRTRTNIVKFNQPKSDAHYTTLMPSGLLGPVRLLAETQNQTPDRDAELREPTTPNRN